MILLDDFERGCVWDFGVFCYFDSGAASLVENGGAIATRSTHGFSPSSRMYNSNRFGAFMMNSLRVAFWIHYDVSRVPRRATGGESGQRIPKRERWNELRTTRRLLVVYHDVVHNMHHKYGLAAPSCSLLLNGHLTLQCGTLEVWREAVNPNSDKACQSSLLHGKVPTSITTPQGQFTPVRRPFHPACHPRAVEVD